MEKILENLYNDITWITVIIALVFGIVIRLILCYFKALAHFKGETNSNPTENEKKKRKSKRIYFKESFLSNSGKHEIDDHWLPYIIGVFELILFPLLYKYQQSEMMGAWLAFKALANWSTKNSRTAYNRFLLGNILALFGSFVIWKCFIKVII